MKKYLLVLPLLLVAAMGFAQVGEPKIEFDNKEHQYGTIPEGPKVSHTFEISNTGNAPLVISSVQPSCGCTAAEYTKEPIMPGKKGIIKADYNTEGRPGRFDKTIRVYTNAPGDNEVILHIKGEVTPKSTK